MEHTREKGPGGGCAAQERVEEKESEQQPTLRHKGRDEEKEE